MNREQKPVKNNVNNFFAESFIKWFDSHLEGKLKDHFDILLTKGLDECELKEYITDVYTDEYLEDIANSDNSGFSFYRHLRNNQINYGASVFIKVWIDCCSWFEENYDLKHEIKSEEFAWNLIAYWIIKEYCADDWENLFVERFEEDYLIYKDNKTKTSRIVCGVCLENKIIYTGCSTCKGNYLCHSCYNHLNNKNECPFCRSQEMILDIEYMTADDNTSKIFNYNVVPELMSVLESRVIN
jgi:transposase-like protein